MSKQPIFLKTKRLYLAPINILRHAKNCVLWKNDEEISKYLSELPPITLEQEKNYLARAVEDTTQKIFAIETVDGQHIGITDLHEIKYSEKTAHSGSLLGLRRGEGLGKEAKLLLLRYAFHYLGLRKVYAKVVEGNESCIRHLLACGYQEEARLKQHYCRDGGYRDQIIFSIFRETFDAH